MSKNLIFAQLAFLVHFFLQFQFLVPGSIQAQVEDPNVGGEDVFSPNQHQFSGI